MKKIYNNKEKNGKNALKSNKQPTLYKQFMGGEKNKHKKVSIACQTIAKTIKNKKKTATI